MKHVTLLFLRRNSEILLAMKKRGFGTGKWNGVGGKVEPGETPLAAAIRECEEEIGVTPLHPRKLCEIDFYLSDEPDFNNYAHVYVAEQWQGDPRETDEMRPQWFALDNIPYEGMWGDDRAWLPLVLNNKRFRATFTLDGDENIVHSKITELTSKEDFS